MDVPGAAEVLGLSNDAVRKRASRGTVPARKTGSRWQVGVIIDRTLTDNQPDTNRTDDLITQPSESARLQLEAIRDEWLQPLINQITDQAEEIGRLKSEIRALQSGPLLSEAPVPTETVEEDVGVEKAAQDAQKRLQPPWWHNAPQWTWRVLAAISAVYTTIIAVVAGSVIVTLAISYGAWAIREGSVLIGRTGIEEIVGIVSIVTALVTIGVAFFQYRQIQSSYEQKIEAVTLSMPITASLATEGDLQTRVIRGNKGSEPQQDPD